MDQVISGWSKTDRRPKKKKKVFVLYSFQSSFTYVIPFDSSINPTGRWLVSFYREKMRIGDVK